MKRIVVVSAMVGLVLALFLYGWLDLSAPSDVGRVDAEKIVKAIGRYKADKAGKVEGLPDFVSMEELVTHGYLNRTDVAGFAGMDAQIALKVDETQPQDVLFRVRMQDGTEIFVQSDGSVQHVTQHRLQKLRDSQH